MAHLNVTWKRQKVSLLYSIEQFVSIVKLYLLNIARYWIIVPILIPLHGELELHLHQVLQKHEIENNKGGGNVSSTMLYLFIMRFFISHGMNEP